VIFEGDDDADAVSGASSNFNDGEWPPSRDQSVLASATQQEFPLDGEFEPCSAYFYEDRRVCLSTDRMIVHLFSNSGKKLMCGNEHNVPHKGKPFISPSEFGPGGDFYNMIDPEFLPPDAKFVAGKWKISKGRQAVLSQFAECAYCGAAPYVGRGDKAEAWAWIHDNDKVLFLEIQRALQFKSGINLSEWYTALPLSLRTKVQRRLDKSTLCFDHGIPRKVGNEIWLRLSADERTILQNDLVFKLCRHCNLGKSARLEVRDAILSMYVDINYGGSMAAAVADSRRWQAIHGVFKVVYGESKSA
jgi:hypothetical protein